MFLPIDIGNSTILLGVYDQNHLLLHGRITTQKEKNSSFYGPEFLNILSPFPKEKIGKIRRCLISSVVPRLDPVFKESLEKFLGLTPIFLDPLNSGMPIKTLHPQEVGADRIANAVAAYELYSGPVVVVDFGTATTFDVISKEGEYLGGLITPGIETSAQAMWEKAEKLYAVEITKPESIIGRDTTTCMQAGIFYGAVSQMEGIISRLREKFEERLKVVLTGGLCHFMAQNSKLIDEVNPLLTLEGLRIISERMG